MLYYFIGLCYYLCMLSLTYLEKKQAKVLEKEKYQESFLLAYDHDLKEKETINRQALVAHKKEQFKEHNAKAIRKAEQKSNAYSKRVWEIDAVRALIIIGMLIDHFFFDVWCIFPSIVDRNLLLGVPAFLRLYNFANLYWVHPVRNAFRLLGVSLLAFLVGINTRFSRSTLKRGLIIFFCGLGISLVFYILSLFNLTGLVLINAISCYGLCLLIYTGIHSLLGRFKKAWKWICLGIAVTIFVIWTFVAYSNKLPVIEKGFDNFYFIFLSDSHCIPAVYSVKDIGFTEVFKILFGLSYFGDDWLPLFPYLGFVFLGAFVGQTVYANKKSLFRFADRDETKRINEKFNRATKPLTFFGHHTLVIYALHQVVYIVLFVLIACVFGGIPLAL